MTDKDPKERIIELNTELGEELGEWEKLGVDPQQVLQFNTVSQKIWLVALTDFLVQKGIIDEDEFLIFWKEKMLADIKTMRTDVEKQVRAAKMKSLGVELPDMAVPQEKIRKLH